MQNARETDHIEEGKKISPVSTEQTEFCEGLRTMLTLSQERVICGWPAQWPLLGFHSRFERQ